MSHMIEPHRTVGCKRGSELSFGCDASEYTANLQDFQSLQIAHIARRFVVSAALARTVADLAFAKGRLR